METSDVRKRILRIIEEARRTAAERRTRADATSAAYESFLTRVAAPVFWQMADALNAEKYAFKVFTPSGGLRLASDRSGNDFIEIELDDSVDPPVVLGRASHSRGSRVIRTERPIAPRAGVEDLTDHDVLEFLLEEIAALIER
jgi:hypothetical protein